MWDGNPPIPIPLFTVAASSSSSTASSLCPDFSDKMALASDPSTHSKIPDCTMPELSAKKEVFPLDNLKEFNTPQITNVVATYPGISSL